MLELNSLKEEINATHDEDMVVLVIKDYLDQISDLKKKLGGIRSMTTNEVDTPRVTQLEEDRDGVTFNVTYTVDDWMVKTRRKLFLQKETQERENRKQENQDKLLLQETLRAVSRTKIRNLNSRREFLPWYEDYQKIKETFKKTNLSDWKENVLKMAKESLKIQADIDACMYLNGLKEFEQYISTEYIVGVNMLNDLFRKLFSSNRASDIGESIGMSTEALNIIRTVKSRNLWEKFSDVHLDKVIKLCLLKRDANEFENEWAKRRSKAMFETEAAELSEDEEGTGIDMDKTISDEITKGSLDERKTFLIEFLRTKLIELGAKKASARNLGNEAIVEKKPKKSVRFKKGDRVFNVTEVDEEVDDLDSDEDIAEDLEAILALGRDDARQQGPSKRKSKLPQKKCPLKCERKTHTNGSAFFCPIWKMKDQEEKKELVKKIPLCILCLARGNKEHECPVGKCAKCGGHHNISLCPRNETEAALKIGENGDDDTDS